MKKTTRRSFLKTTAVGLPGLALATGAAAAASVPSRAESSYQLMRRIPAEKGAELVVAGGGPAGVSAAICAARLGAKVVLLEATGSLGGMGTNGMVSNWYSMGDDGNKIVGGLILELVQTLCRDGLASPNAAEAYRQGQFVSSIGFNPESVKLLLDRLCAQAGVEVRFFTKVIDVEVDPQARRVNGVVTHSIEGYRYIRAQTFVDGTGDAVLADLCGAAVRAAGRDTPRIMPPTLCAQIAGLDTKRWERKKQQAMVEQAIADKFFTQPDRHVPGLFPGGENTVTMNAGHLFNTNALETRSLTDAMILGRRLVQEYASFYRKYMPGCESIQVMATGSLLGVRESRRIVGEYELNYADFTARRHFQDQIAIYKKSVDIHVYDLSDEDYKRYLAEFTVKDVLKKGESYGIPYGILVPKGWTNLWVAGRCVSADLKVHGAIRDQPACSMMGQAAGTAAIQAIRTGQPANDLDTRQLIDTLRQAGARLPQRETSRTMTRRA